MSGLNWLEKADVLAIHADILRQTDEPPELLSDHLLESALARPLNLAAYGEPDLFDLAASYAEAIARNHCFANGNKRTAFIAADSFLRANGITLPVEGGDEHTRAMVQLSQGLMSRDEFAAYLKSCGSE